MENHIGTSIKGYELREHIGAGGFGAVYRAHQSSVGREVAVKIILPSFANHPEFIRRFETEAQLIARLEHPYIIPLYDYWRDPEGAYLVMRYLRGGSLRDTLQEGPFDLRAAAMLLDQIASALAVAHRNHVIHRDLKPPNILMDEDGNAYLADFGIAKDLANLNSSATQPEAIVGSPDYLSPEQVRSERVTPQTDIYSLGIILYEVLVGEHAFPNITPVERLYKHLNEPVPKLHNLKPEVLEAVNNVIQKATAKNPQDRYPNVMVLAQAFREAACLNQSNDKDRIVELLTQREQEVLQRIILGQSNREIADELVVTIGTVKWYIRQIYGKLHVRSRVQAIVRARELNLVVAKSEDASKPQGSISSAYLPEPENPYKGLRAFQSADYRDFFGRETLTQKLLKRLGEQNGHGRFLAVIGPSGSGKSSLVKAGLMPALWRGELPGSANWFIVDMLPGTHPLDELEITLLRLAADQSGNIKEQLQRDPRGLLRTCQLILPKDESELVLVIDQFEEVFTLVEDEAARVHFLDLLYTTANDPRSRVRIVITLRADFYDRPLHYPEFGELVRSHMETILPLSADELERAITRPAAQVGVTFEPGLVASIVSEVNYQPGALPLLQYALTELFEQRQNRTMSHEAYRAIGGTVGALARRADEIYEGLDVTGQEITRQMFLRLVTLGEGVEDTRRRVGRDELMAIASDKDVMDEVIDTYAAYRLLSLDHNPGTRIPTVEVAHEAILREWKRLRGWLHDSREEIRLQRQLAAMATEWKDAKRDSSFLVQGSRLDQFERWSHTTQLALTPVERDYLAASLLEHERREMQERQRQAREAILERRAVNNLRALVAVLALATMIALGLSLFAFDREARAQNNFSRAERIRLASQAQIALDQGEDIRIPALLSMRSLQVGYSPEADAALLLALNRSAARQIYIGHTDGLSTAAFSPDGRYVVTGAIDSTARLWDTQTGQELFQLVGHSGLINRAIFSPDGRYILTDGTDGTVRLWDVTTGQEVRRLLDQGSPVLALAFSPDGRYIATSDNSSLAQLWDVETMTLMREFVGHTDMINQLAFSEDGRYLATGSFDYSARVWEIATGDELQHFEGHAGCVCWVDFSPDGNMLVTASYDSTARLWDTNTGDELNRLTGHNGQVMSAEFSPDGRFIVTTGRSDHTIRLWDVETQQEIQELLGHTADVVYATFSPDGRFVLSVGTDNTARLWDLTIEREPRILQNPLAAIHANSVVFIGLSPDDQRVITVNGAGLVQTWDIETGRVVHEILTENNSFIVDAALSPNGQFVLTPGTDGSARLWDIYNEVIVQQYDGNTASILTVEFSPDGDSILTGAEDGSTILWDVQSGEIRQRFLGHTSAINTLTFSPNGRFIATASHDATVRLWDVQSGQEIRRFNGHTGAVLSIAFSPDAQFLLTGGEDNTARLWNLETGEEIHQLVSHILPVSVVAFSPDGRNIITASLDQTALIWEIEGFSVIRQFTGLHTSALRSLTMSRDGQFLVTGDLNAAYVWRVDLEAVIQLTCTRIYQDFTPEERVRYAITDNTDICANSREGENTAQTVWTLIPTQLIPMWTPIPSLDS